MFSPLGIQSFNTPWPQCCQIPSLSKTLFLHSQTLESLYLFGHWSSLHLSVTSNCASICPSIPASLFQPSASLPIPPAFRLLVCQSISPSSLALLDSETPSTLIHWPDLPSVLGLSCRASGVTVLPFSLGSPAPGTGRPAFVGLGQGRGRPGRGAGRGGAGAGRLLRLSGPCVRGLAGGEHGAAPGRRAPRGWRTSRPAAVGAAARAQRRPAALALDLLAGQVRAAPRRFVSAAS